MKTKKTFFKVFGVAIAVALLGASCTNVEPTPKPIPPSDKLPVSESFANGFGTFTQFSVSGDQVWEHTAQYGYVLISGYVSKTNLANEDWLISGDIDLSDVTAAKLTFDHASRYFGNLATDATIWASENYVSGDPTSATWTQVTTPAFKDQGNWTMVSSGEISLTAFAGKKIRIAFKYISTTTKAGTWQIKNFKVEEGEAQGEQPGAELNICGDMTASVSSLIENFDGVVNNSDIALTGWKVFQVKGDRNWQGKVFTSGANTETYAQATAYNGGAANYESWLVSPPLNLDAADSKTLSFKTAKAFWNATSSLKVYVLQCDGSTTTKTELTSANIVKETDTDHVFVSSGIVDLSAFSGKVYIGFQYVALGGASNSTTFRVDDVSFNNVSNTATTVSFTSQAPTSAYIGTAFTYNIQTNVINALGNTEISVTGLPAWADFSANTNGTANITGTPDEAGSYSITITATNNSVVATQVFTLVVTPAPVVGDNLLTNPSFELWEENKPKGWSLISTTETEYYEESTIVQDGDKSFKVDASGSATVNWAQTVAITGGQKYRLSMSYYILSGDGSDARIWSNFKKGDAFYTEAELIATNLFPDLRGPGNTYSSGSAYFPDEKGAWKTYTITFTAPTDATAFDFQFRTYRNAVVYWDNFSLVNVIE